MIRPLRQALARFRRAEEGHATIEFAITFPSMLFLLLSGVELGMMSIQHASLERALDLTVRDIRLGTGSAPQHNEIKDLICERAGYISDCKGTLRLEMVLVDPRNWTSLSADADCIDASKPVEPVRSFTNGMDNELMVLRACAKVKPVFPTTGLGKNVVKDGDGAYALLSSTVFVQEPR